MRKVASPAKSIDEFAKLIAKNGLKDSMNLAKKRMISDRGTGSFLLDTIGGKRIRNSAKIKNLQSRLANLDMKGGGVAYDFFDNRKNQSVNKMKNMFVNEHTFNKGVNASGGMDAVKLKTTGLLNPLTKTKNSVFPFVGGMTVAGSVLPNGSSNNSEVDYNGMQ